MKRIAILLSMFLAVAVATAAEDFRLAAIFRDNMVLQREMPVPVWGWAAPGTQVTVDFAGQSKKAEAGKDGRWQVTLDPLKTNATGTTLEAKTAAAVVTLNNILVGEVWIAAGQSNMIADGPDEDTGVYPHYTLPPNADKRPEIRTTTTFGNWYASLEPVADLDEKARDKVEWKTLAENPYRATMSPFEYFARTLRDGLGDVPVGVICVAVAGVSQLTWMDRATMEALPALAEGSDHANLYAESLARYKTRTEEEFKASEAKTWEEFIAQWEHQQKHYRGSNSLALSGLPAVLHNTRIAPLAPFAFRGAIWHQGEAGPGGDYGERLIAMYGKWRELFGHQLHFLAGTLSRATTEHPPLAPVRQGFYRAVASDSIRATAPKFREDGRADFVELYDLGDWGTHFMQKAEMGRRMGLAALNQVHGQNHIHSGPRAVETRIDGGKATVRFALVGDGLVFKPSIDGISGIIVESTDGQTVHWANVKVTGKDTIELSHPDIAEIKTISYGEHPNPHETLFNSAALPASPFTVNPDRPLRVDNTPVLLAHDDPSLGKQVTINTVHVRAEGYVFSLRPEKDFDGSPVKIRAFIPAGWKAFEVESNGKKTAATETTEDGVRTATFEATPDGTVWIIVAEAGKAETFRKVNRY